MTTTNAVEFEALPGVENISTPNLSDEESVALLDCINNIRSGRKQYLVLVRHRKARKPNGNYAHGRARVPGQDYDALPGVSPETHIGWMTKAPTNQQGNTYVYVYDEARALDGERGHTNMGLDDIYGFRVLAERPGPLARLEQQPQGFQPQGFDPRWLMAQACFAQAQACFAQAQACFAMGQALLAQAQQPAQQPAPH